MTTGIYGYIDNKKEQVVYIGQSVDMEQRNIAHHKKSQYDVQQINRVLQNNLDRYSFEIIEKCNRGNLNTLEKYYIQLFNPLFNFTEGGDVIPHKPRYGDDNPFYGKHHTEKTKKHLSDIKKGENNPNYKNYARVVKQGKGRHGEPNFAIHYKSRCLTESINKEKLEKICNYLNFHKLSYDDTKLFCNPPKKHARIIKGGYQRGKQKYILRYNHKFLKGSINRSKLEPLCEYINKNNLSLEEAKSFVKKSNMKNELNKGGG